MAAAGLRIADVADNHDRHISYEDLKILKSIGSGCSSTVKLAMHKVTGELFALKCISLYVKQMRDQLMTELRMLFKSDCEGLIDFYGAVYREVGFCAACVPVLIDRPVAAGSRWRVVRVVCVHLHGACAWSLRDGSMAWASRRSR